MRSGTEFAWEMNVRSMPAPGFLTVNIVDVNYKKSKFHIVNVICIDF